MSVWFVVGTMFAVVAFIHFVCKAGSASVGKLTEEGETLNQNIQFYIWDTKASRAKKLQVAYDLGVERAQWIIDKERQIIDETVDEKAKLKAVDGS